MKAANGDGIVEQDPVIGGIDDAGRKLPALAEGVASGGVERGVDGQVVAVVRAHVGAAQAVVKAGAVIDVGREPRAERQDGGEAGVECIALVMVNRGVVEAQRTGGVAGERAGESADDVAALFGDLVGVGDIEVAEMQEFW